MSKWLENVANMRGVVAICILSAFLAVIITLIINPNALNLEKNQVIGIVIGFLLKATAEIIDFYFKRANNSLPKTDTN